MSTLLFATYVLIWPFLSAGVLALLLGAVVKEFRAARKSGRELV